MAHRYYQLLGNSITLQPYTNLSLKSVTGDPLLVLGRISVSVAMGILQIPSMVDFIVVEDLPYLNTVLLGTEFFMQHVHSFEWSTHSMFLKQDTTHRLPLSISTTMTDVQSVPSSTPASQATISVIRSIKIPPYTSASLLRRYRGLYLLMTLTLMGLLIYLYHMRLSRLMRE